MALANRPVAKFAHTSGITKCEYTADGTHLLSVGANLLLRKYTVGSDNEPRTVDRHADAITCLSVSDRYVVTAAEDRTVTFSELDLDSCRDIYRASVPIRDTVLSPDEQWVAIATEY
jgi:chromosome transmission fidelity protein 4